VIGVNAIFSVGVELKTFARVGPAPVIIGAPTVVKDRTEQVPVEIAEKQSLVAFCAAVPKPLDDTIALKGKGELAVELILELRGYCR
jgi:hypothetical protein